MYYPPSHTPALSSFANQMWGQYQQPQQLFQPSQMQPLPQQASSNADLVQPTATKRKIKPVAPAPPPLPPPAARKSSLIDPDVDDSVLIKEFFRWVLKKTPPNRHVRVGRIYSIVEDQEWTIDDLKSMADPSSTPYRVATEKGISNEAARKFKAELALFGPYYRAAKRLLMVAQGGEPADGNGNDASGDDEAKDEEEEDEEDEDEMEDEVT